MSIDNDEVVIRECVEIMLSDPEFNQDPWDRCLYSEHYAVGVLSMQDFFLADGKFGLLGNRLTRESKHRINSILGDLRRDSGLAVPWNAIAVVVDRASRSGYLHRFYGSAAEWWDGYGGDRVREEAARLLTLSESTEVFGESEFAIDMSTAIDAVADYIRERGLDVDARELLAARFEGGWRVYVPEDPSEDLLDVRLGRMYFLVSDQGRVGEVSSSVPPAQAIADFLAQDHRGLPGAGSLPLSPGPSLGRRIMQFQDTYCSRQERYSLGIESNSGRYYVSIPVSNGIVDYEEYYELSAGRYHEFLENPTAAIEFADECRRREHDDLLLEQPGGNRGTPV